MRRKAEGEKELREGGSEGGEFQRGRVKLEREKNIKNEGDNERKGERSAFC